MPMVQQLLAVQYALGTRGDYCGGDSGGVGAKKEKPSDDHIIASAALRN
jgi:hypothetical protein